MTLRRGRRGVVALLVAAFVPLACQPADDVVHVGPLRPGCDPMAARGCLYPFPNDLFSVADPSTDTGRRVAFVREAMPRNVAGAHVDPTEWNRNDGFSPGGPIVTYVPGLDLGRSGVAPSTDIGRSLDRRAPIVLLDADTGERHPYWAELDDKAALDDREANPALLVRPAVNLVEGHRYVVALRRLRDTSGDLIEAGDVFRAYRDRLATDSPAVEARRPHVESLLSTLAEAGVRRSELHLAWDFTVASTRSLTERVLAARDDALASLGGGAPAFTAARSTTDTAEEGAVVVEGSFDVPLYLTEGGVPGSRFAYGPDGLPRRTGTYRASYLCVLPPDGAATARALVYGHGLLGSRREVLGFGDYAVDHDSVLCATDWIGLSGEDAGNSVRILNDLSHFPTLADRLQQSFVNVQFLARLLRSPAGFATSPLFAPLAPGDVAYWGRSQGGTIGGAATAISTEWTRAVLGEGGINYSTLLDRSVDYDPFEPIAKAAYLEPTERTILQPLSQMLWDRAEGNGYAAHMTDDPLPGTPAHDVLLFEAFGDHQVANVATEVAARTIGARLREPALAPRRSLDRRPFWGIEPIPSEPWPGSALLVWDFGTPPPPPTNIPPRGPAYGQDPHDLDVATPEALAVIAAFLAPDGSIGDVCGGDPCDARPPPTPAS